MAFYVTDEIFGISAAQQGYVNPFFMYGAGVSPALRAVMPRVKETAKYPIPMGMPALSPRKKQAVFSFCFIACVVF